MSIYDSGNHSILGDCLDVLPLIPDKSIDLVLADLPFNISLCAWDTPIPLDILWDHFRRICKDVSTVVLFGTQPFTSRLVMSNPKAFRHEWIWEKDKGANFAHVKRSPFKEHENIVVFNPNKRNKYFPIMEKRRGNGLNLIGAEYIPNYNKGRETIVGAKFPEGKKSITTELRYPRSIQRFNRETGLHPTQKPLELIDYLVKTYSEEGDRVLDPTAGSFTTAVSCARLNRSYICIEKDEQFYNIGVNRLNGQNE